MKRIHSDAAVSLLPAPAKAARRRAVAQAWIEAIAEDPAAVSALAVARRVLAGGEDLRALRRVRLIEIEGALPDAQELALRLHDSTRFYNPHKERCAVRRQGGDASPLAAGERAVLVFDRDGERRPAAERWWKRVTGDTVRVREGTAWVGEAASGARRDALLAGLLPVAGLGSGLLCNAHAQEFRCAEGTVPLPWFSSPPRTRRKKA